MQYFPDGLPRPRRDWAMATIALAITMSVMDSSIANVALPTIARDLHTNPADSIWIVNGYQLAIAVTLLPLAALGEIITYRRIYTAGIVLFTLASLTCALSQSFAMLAAARVLQGLGAAGIMSVNTALVRYTWPRKDLGHGIGINALVVAVAAAMGPTIAAGILSIGDWPWLFAVNVPLGLIAIWMARSALPDSPRAQRRFDWRSALLTAGTFGLLILSVDAVGHGEHGIIIAGEAISVIVLGVWLVRRQFSLDAPLLPVDLLAKPIIGLSAATSTLAFIGQMLALVALPFLLETRLGFSAVAIGLLITPWAVSTGLVAPLAGKLSDHYPAGLLGGIGLLAFAAGLAALGFLPEDASIGNILWRMALCGAGFGLFQSPNNRAIIGNAPLTRTGGAAGLLGTARLLGQTLGAALVALLFARLGQAAGELNALRLGAAIAFAGACVSAIRLMDRTEPEENTV